MTSVDWLEVRLQGDISWGPLVEVALPAHGLSGWVDESSSERFSFLVYLPQEPGWQERLARLQESLPPAAALSTHEVVRDEDWAENWKQFYHPLKVGQRLVVCPSWETYLPQSDELVLTLDPGSAFGTGYHWSTRLCLEQLEASHPVEGVLDLGTGSGILAIAAVRLGFASIVAVDNDPVAVKVARENLAINGCDQVRVELAEGPPPGDYRLILANLVAGLLLELAESLVERLLPEGELICGGIISPRAQEVLERFQSLGLNLVSLKEREEWVSLRLVKS